MNAETKVGLFSIAGFALLGLAIFMLGDFSIKQEYPLYVEFKDVAGLPEKSTVRLSGMQIGKVKDIQMEDSRVVVRVAIRKGVRIYRDSVFQIGSTSLIGSKYLQIDQGTPSSGVIDEGARVAGSNTLPLDRMITSTLGSMQKLIDGVNQNGNLGRSLGQTMDNLRQLTANLNELIVIVQPRVENSMANAESISKRLDGLIAKADTLIDKINSGQGMVGALINDQQMKTDVKQTMANVKDASGKAKDILGRVGGFKVYWQYTNRFDPQADTSRSGFGIKIAPRDGRYYYLGLANLRNSSDFVKPNDYEEANRLEAQLGWEGANYDIYAGLIRGAGGIGMKYRPFRDVAGLDRLTLVGEASDYLRDRNINGRHFTGTRYDLGADVRVNRFVSVGARFADIRGTGDMEYTGSLKFEDKDVAYLLGLVSLGAMRSGGN
jgi:phospholipid/cholesterol/gamma-HCH transport system substrate-binding protein